MAFSFLLQSFSWFGVMTRTLWRFEDWKTSLLFVKKKDHDRTQIIQPVWHNDFWTKLIRGPRACFAHASSLHACILHAHTQCRGFFERGYVVLRLLRNVFQMRGAGVVLSFIKAECSCMWCSCVFMHVLFSRLDIVASRLSSTGEDWGDYALIHMENRWNLVIIVGR